jgi:hypothetical protein
LPTSFLLVEEYFATGDDRFVDALRDFHVAGSLASLADKWRRDPRPWARQQVLKYLALPLDAAAHETVVKRLFKSAEEKQDDELMGAFALAFDRLVRRRRQKLFRYDWQTRQRWTEEVLFSPRNVLPTPSPSAKVGPVMPQFHPTVPRKRNGRLFSYRTRFYLRRRAWRYFRRMGFQRAAAYPGAVAAMLKRYTDSDLAQGEFILDSWTLLHACFGRSDVLEFGASLIRIREGRALRELTPAPDFPALWKTPDGGRRLIDLLLDAGSRLVRTWAIQLLGTDHAESLQTLPVSDIRRLLEHPDDEVQALGAQLLEGSTQLDKLTVAAWLELLTVRSPAVLETICRLMARQVQSGRLDLRQCVQLAGAKPAPVARLGFEFLRERDIRTEADRDILADLADARCAVVAGDLAAWALNRLGAAGVYRVERAVRFFDSLLRETREAAWSWLTPAVPGWGDADLWSRLVETPYDDVRLHFVSALQQRSQAPGVGAAQLSNLWCGVLLGIHRGGRHKLTALRQISDAVQMHPESAELLLPVLAVAIRSVRPPEARAGLAAIVAAVEARPELSELISRVLPELKLYPAGAAP